MNGRPLYRDRRDAGRALAARLKEIDFESPVVVALPRGGVPVAYEVATELGAPLDIALVRKLGAPDQPELGIGALGEEGTVVVDAGTVRALGVSSAELESAIARERAELERRRARYAPDGDPIDVAGRDVILVDDGIATGVTAAVAARVLKARGAARVIAAVPVSPPGVGEALASYFDAFVSLASPVDFGGVGAWYADFAQTSDDEVVELLRATGKTRVTAVASGPSDHTAVADAECSIPTRDGMLLPGRLLVPATATGLVIFVHGTGSSRHSPRNLAVARRLAESGLAALLFDLLTEEESERHGVFDVELLTRRLRDATSWATQATKLRGLSLGYFGASTGAGAALRAAAELGDAVGAVVCRGGRPDLAGDALTSVVAPTLLIVGGNDWTALDLNDEAATVLGGPRELAVIPGAGHLFEEPGALDDVARLAGGWFVRHLATTDPARSSPRDLQRPPAERA
jgi:putative phosphoribosyl transferase